MKMKWYCSKTHRPKYGTVIFLWDEHGQKQHFIKVLFPEQNWKMIPSQGFPIWSYVFDGLEPELINEARTDTIPEQV